MNPVADQQWMHQAIRYARLAADLGERPFGCVIVDEGGKEIARGAGTGTHNDPLRHSEMEAITDACEERGGLLLGCTLYSTHEPCTMCCGAVNHAKVSRLVWGSYRAQLPELFRRRRHDAFALLGDTTTPCEIRGGVLLQECLALFEPELDELRQDIVLSTGAERAVQTLFTELW